MLLQRTCLECKKLFMAKANRVRSGEAKYCSLKCSTKQPRGGKRLARRCRYCKKTFVWHASPSRLKRGTGKFCSISCHIKWQWQYNPPRPRAKKPGRYLMIYCFGHPLADSTGRLLEHRLVLFDKIGPGTHPCYWCRKKLTWEYGLLEVDHLNNHGRDNQPKNLVASCHRCNTRRHHPTLIRDGELFIIAGSRKLRAVKRLCEHCRQEFLIYPKRGAGRFCSLECYRGR